MTDDIERKLITFPGVDVSPEVVLHRTLQKLPRIKAVTIIIQWDDETMSVDWSSQKTSHLCMASVILADVARKVVTNDGDDEP